MTARIIIPAHPGFYLHGVHRHKDQWHHVKFAIVAWDVGDKGNYTIPITAGICDSELTSLPDDDFHLAIEHPDGSYAAHTGYTFDTFEGWQSAVREGEEA